MPLLDNPGELMRTFAPLLSAIAAVCVGLWTARWLLLRPGLALGNERRLPRQMTMLGLTAVGVVCIVLALPVADSTRAQLLTLLGLLVSAIIGLSSTTLVANAMAGLMLRTTKGFRTGDFIRVEGQFGRVTERGLLHTEIQTEERELTTLPNLFLISNPVTVVRSSGTLVSISLSLGYDVHHARIEPLLLEAATSAELQEPFVRVLELGDHAVTYRVSGFLEEIKNLLTARSNLCKAVLSTLHAQGIEIVSPSLMFQRPLPPDARVIPAPIENTTRTEDRTAAEDLMFDKAEQAEQVEEHRLRLQAEIDEIEGRLGQTKGDARAQLEEQLGLRRKDLAALTSPAEPAGGTPAPLGKVDHNSHS